jgi:hypothetical protein
MGCGYISRQDLFIPSAGEVFEMKIDFFARQAYYLDHLAPLWNALDPSLRGEFYLNDPCLEHARQILPKDTPIHAYLEGNDCGAGPIVTCAYGDAFRAVEWNEGRPVILFEHGVGLTFGKAAYADGLGQRIGMAMFPVPNQHTLDRVNPELRDRPHPIVGMPKLDKWAGEFSKPHLMPRDPRQVTIAVSFHHGSAMSRPAEVGSAIDHYIGYLPELAKHFKLLVHSHPITAGGMADVCRSENLEFEPDFQEVMRRADIYMNDCSSTLYEFLVTGKPVIILNAPWFDRNSKWGIRFWEYSDVGPQVDYPEQLLDVVGQMIANPDALRPCRSRAVSDLFPYLGKSASRAVSEITKFLKVQPAPPPVSVVIPKLDKIRQTADRGILYMCFGVPAFDVMVHSVETLRATGSTLPTAAVGDFFGSTVNRMIKWQGGDPYDSDKIKGFQFRAGRVKPFLYALSPFKETLYVDADVEFLVDPEVGFNFLKHWDFVIAQERLSVCDLYNRPRAGWQHNIDERDATVEAYGGDGHFPFWNSGVFFFRKNRAVEGLFALWYEEWCQWQQWDEQLALMRAANRSQARVFVLSEIWNHPHKQEAKIIAHEYGIGKARSSII